MRFRFRYIFATVAQGAKKWDRPKCLSLREFHTSGGRIRTSDLRVMSPTSYLAALPRDRIVLIYLTIVRGAILPVKHSGEKKAGLQLACLKHKTPCP